MNRNCAGYLKKSSRLAFVWFLIFSFCLAGCSLGCSPALKKKFIRKSKKEEKQEEVIYETREYTRDEIPPEVRYKEHYIFWRIWQEELINALDAKSRKRQIDCLNEAVANLIAMQENLIDAKKDGIVSHVRFLQTVADEINKGRLSSPDIHRLKRSLEHQKREIVGEFSYNKVGGWIRE